MRPAEDTWVLTFRVEAVEHALPVRDVVEVVRMVALTPVPAASPWVAGVLNYRGRVVPVVDTRTRLGRPRREPDPSTPIVVIEAGAAAAGLIVDEALDVLPLPATSVEPAGGSEQAYGPVAHVARTGERLILLLDAAGLCAEHAGPGVTAERGAP